MVLISLLLFPPITIALLEDLGPVGTLTLCLEDRFRVMR
jgi:hypothetical protein